MATKTTAVTGSKVINEILAPVRNTELVCQTHMKQIDMLHRIIERFKAHNSESMQEVLDKLAREEKRLNQSIDRLIERRDRAMEYINQLTNEEYAVIYRYYIMGQTWDKIAEETYFSIRNVYIIKRKALEKLEKIYCMEVQNG